MKPILLHYYITNRCNARCVFCSIWSETPKTDAKLHEVKNTLAAARKEGCKFVDFTGGEPLLHPDIPQFLYEAKRLGYITSVTTNCLLFPDRAKELAEKVDLLHFSLDGDTADIHDELRGVRSFDHVMRSIPIALENRLVPDLLFTYTDKNIDTFEGVYRIAEKNRLIAILDPVFSMTGPDKLHRSTHLKALKYSKLPGVYLNKAHITVRFSGGNHIRQPICRSVDSTIVVTPDNKRVLPCFHHRCISMPPPDREMLTKARNMQGKYPFCEGCHINCYFDPSYNYLHNRLFFQSLGSKFSYIIMKYFIYGRIRSFFRLYLRAK